MDLLLIRHAIAEDRDDFNERTGLDDSERPLTRKGARRMAKAAPALKPWADDIGLFVTSPFVRAVETARIVVAGAGFPEPVETVTLTPDQHPERFATWFTETGARLAKAAGGQRATVAVTGHEPQLSRLIGWLVTGEDRLLGSLKKGGLCVLTFPGEPVAGEGRIEALLKAGQLRRLAMKA